MNKRKSLEIFKDFLFCNNLHCHLYFHRLTLIYFVKLIKNFRQMENVMSQNGPDQDPGVKPTE